MLAARVAMKTLAKQTHMHTDLKTGKTSTVNGNQRKGVWSLPSLVAMPLAVLQAWVRELTLTLSRRARPY